MRNHTCVPPNQNSHKEEEDTILNVTLFLLSTEDLQEPKALGIEINLCYFLSKLK